MSTEQKQNIMPDFSFGTTEDLFSGFTPLLEGLQPSDDKDIKVEQIEPIDGDIPDHLKDEVEDTVSDDEDIPDHVLESLNQNDDVDDSDETEQSDNDEYEYSYKEIAAHLADIGLLDELDDDVEDTPDALELAVKKTIDNSISTYKESIPDVGKQFLDYLEKGGDPYTFLETVNRTVDYKTLDLENEDNQKLVLREYFKTQDWSAEEIEDALLDYEEGMILKKRAEKAIKDLDKIHSKQVQELQAQQEAANAERLKQYEEYVNTVKTSIHSTNQLAGLQITEAEKSQFEKYLLEADKDGLTGYAKDLQSNPVQTQLELAYLKFKKFDFSKVAKEIRTKETRNFRKKIVETDKTLGSSINRPTDNNKGHLSAFKNL